MKKYIYILILLLMVHVSFGYTADDYLRSGANLGSKNKTLDPMYLHMVDFANSAGATGTGRNWYVDSGVANEGDGSSWARAFDTVDEAINASSADGGGGRGDWIHVAQNSDESGIAAGLFDADIADMTIKGYGNQASAPTFTFAHANTTVVAGAANVTFINLRFLAGITEVVVGVSVEAAATGFTMIGCVFPEPETSTFEFNIAVQLTTASNDATFINCVAYSADATGADHWLNGGAGAVNRLTLIGNIIVGEFAIAPIFSDQADIECYITNNDITQMTTGELGLEFSGNATGICRDNLVISDAIGNSYDTGLMDGGGGLWGDEDSSDTYPGPWTTNETGVNRWGVTELAQIEGEVDDGVTANATIVDFNIRIPQFVLKSTGDLTSSGASIALFSVTGDVLVIVGASVDVAVTSTSGTTTAEVGIVGNTATLCVQDAIDNTAFDVGDSWTKTVAADANGAEMADEYVLIGNGVDIVMTVNVDDITAGDMDFYCEFIPLSSGATVTAAP